MASATVMHSRFIVRRGTRLPLPASRAFTSPLASNITARRTGAGEPAIGLALRLGCIRSRHYSSSSRQWSESELMEQINKYATYKQTPISIQQFTDFGVWVWVGVRVGVGAGVRVYVCFPLARSLLRSHASSVLPSIPLRLCSLHAFPAP